MHEKHQKELRRFMSEQARRAREGTARVPPEESESTSQAEGEREGGPGRKLKGTPGQAEGRSPAVEEELRTKEEKKKKKH